MANTYSSRFGSRIVMTGFSLIILVIVLLAGLGYLRMASIQSRMQGVVQHYNAHAQIAREMYDTARERIMLFVEMGNTGDPFARDELMMRIRDLGERFMKAREHLEAHELSSDDIALLEQNRALATYAGQVQERLAELYLDGHDDRARRLLVAEAIPAQNEAVEVLNEFIALQNRGANEAVKITEATLAEAKQQLILLASAGVIMSLFVALIVTRASQRQLDALTRRAANERAVRENMSDALLTLDADGLILRANQAARDIFGYAEEGLRGQPLILLFPELESCPGCGDGPLSRELTARSRQGAAIPVEMNLTLLPDTHGDAACIALFHDLRPRRQAETAIREAQDKLEQRVVERTRELEVLNQHLSREVAEKQRAEVRLAYLANHDSLTGLPNRNLFAEQLSKAIAQVDREGHRLALLFMDLDGFKEVNDAYGHAQGDELLRMVANRLKSMVRANDTLARLGGDEFTLLLTGIDDYSAAMLVAEKILDWVHRPLVIEGEEVTVGTSIGVAYYPDDAKDLETLLRAADNAMYAAKQAGRNRYRLADPSHAAGDYRVISTRG